MNDPTANYGVSGYLLHSELRGMYSERKAKAPERKPGKTRASAHWLSFQQVTCPAKPGLEQGFHRSGHSFGGEAEMLEDDFRWT